MKRCRQRQRRRPLSLPLFVLSEGQMEEDAFATGANLSRLPRPPNGSPFGCLCPSNTDKYIPPSNTPIRQSTGRRRRRRQPYRPADRIRAAQPSPSAGDLQMCEMMKAKHTHRNANQCQIVVKVPHDDSQREQHF